jgi:cytochrome c-type biogenesis protein CcmH/NrfG
LPFKLLKQCPSCNVVAFGFFSAFAVALCVGAYPAANAKDSGSVKDTVQCPKDEDPKAAHAEERDPQVTPQDPAIHVEIAKLYFQLEDVSSAERAARAACVLNGDEAHYLNVLLDVLLVRRKFNDIMI